MSMIHIRERYSDTILHSIDVGSRHVELYPIDLRELDLSNLNLNGAELSWANLEGVNLRGAKLKDANLFHANLRNATIDYADLSKADLREANLDGAVMWPSETIGAKFFDAIITVGSEVEKLARMAVQDQTRRRH